MQNVIVLDVACGTGYGCRVLMDGGAVSVLGVDISDDAIRYAIRRYGQPRLNFAVGSILDIPAADHRFDVVTTFETIEHVSDPEKALREIVRILKPGGHLIISTPNRKLTSPGKSRFDHPDNSFHALEYTRDEFTAVLSQSFDLIGLYGQRAISWPFTLPFVRKLTYRILPWIYDPAFGTPTVIKASPMCEYRYIIADCVPVR